MLEVRFAQTKSGVVTGFVASGHAGWDVIGKDIVCAAASVLLQSLMLGLSEVCDVEAMTTKRSGYLSLSWSLEDAATCSVRAVSETTARSIEVLARQFPDHVAMFRETIKE